MTRIALVLCLVLGMLGTGEALADGTFARRVEGAYFAIQQDGLQRVLSLDRGGNISVTAQEQSIFGFTAGEGAWQRTGPNEATATVIDFDFDPTDGAPTGATRTVLVITFSKLESGQFQELFVDTNGAAFAPGVNPLHPEEPPTDIFAGILTGERINVD